jgi:hypothetical protein
MDRRPSRPAGYLWERAGLRGKQITWRLTEKGRLRIARIMELATRKGDPSIAAQQAIEAFIPN